LDGGCSHGTATDVGEGRRGRRLRRHRGHDRRDTDQITEPEPADLVRRNGRRVHEADEDLQPLRVEPGGFAEPLGDVAQHGETGGRVRWAPGRPLTAEAPSTATESM